MKTFKIVALMAIFQFASLLSIYATKFIDISPVNNKIIVVHFSDGFNDFPDDAKGPSAYYGHPGPWPPDNMIFHGKALDVKNAQTTANWSLTSKDDRNYSSGKNPLNVYRKSKVSAASRSNQYAFDHWIYLVLPDELQQGKTYTLKMDANTNTDLSSVSFTFDVFSADAETESIHINLAGYYPAFTQTKSADLYMFMGDGGHVDFSDYEGNDVIAFNTATGDKTTVGKVNFWKKKNKSDIGGNQLIKSPVWNCDLSSLSSTGTYRIAIEGVGCSPEFKVDQDVLYDPYKMAIRGYYYMRLGQKDVKGIKPVPRQPLMIPGDESDGYAPTTVYVTTFHPFGNMPGESGDRWDQAAIWEAGKTGEINPNARGGHTANIYDILLPYILLQGKALNDDNLELAESGDGIPDIIQEAQYEVDFWLSLKVSDGYGSGVTNPVNHHGKTYSGVLYQAAAHPVMAWQSAASCAMTAECYRLSGHTKLMEYYRDKAIEAYNFLKNDEGFTTHIKAELGEYFSGKDLKMTAAAYLYNLTGDTIYENEMKKLCVMTDNPKVVLHHISNDNPYNQLYGALAYMLTNRTVHYPELQKNMKASIIKQANSTNVDANRPSRRTTVEAAGWGYWQSGQNMQRAMVAHTISEDAKEKDNYLKAMLLEADYSMGRNPMNKIIMTGPPGTHYLENTYTTGHNDGTPGIHYGHTPYMMHGDDCWWSNATDADGASGCAEWYTSKGYPEWEKWPYAEGHWNSRYLCPVGEFTPRQTMKGKTALYAYLYGLCKISK